MEDNKRLLANFLEFKKFGFGAKNYLILGQHISVDKIPFDTSWDWLMQVVDKIYSLDIYYSKYIEYNSSMFTDGKIELTTNIKSVFEQCVEFVKWYNKQK